jgi:hypothetical protein
VKEQVFAHLARNGVGRGQARRALLVGRVRRFLTHPRTWALCGVAAVVAGVLVLR